MKKDIVYIDKNEPVTTTKILAQCLGREHSKLINLIVKHSSYFADFGLDVNAIIGDLNSEKRGKKIPKIILNEQQTAFLFTLMKNIPQVVEFKKNLVKEFFRMRKILLNLEKMNLV